MATTAVKDVMTPGPTAIASDAMVVEAARRMLSEDVGSLPVVEGETLVGMVTDRDLVLHVIAKDLDPHKVPCRRRVLRGSGDRGARGLARRRAPADGVRAGPAPSGRHRRASLVGILAQADIARTARPESTGRLVEEISA